MKWKVELYKTNGEMRKQFSTWSVPKNFRDDYSIFDGLNLKITAKIANHEFTRTLKITSGGEFRLPNKISKPIREIAISSNAEQIEFEVDLSKKIQTDFDQEVSKSLSDDKRARRKRLKKAPKKPSTTSVNAVSFNRNPDVVAEVLSKAKGVCKACKNKAPFNRKSDNTPYLEVHHKVRLSDGGEDTVENAIALCPNCHREQHYG